MGWACGEGVVRGAQGRSSSVMVEVRAVELLDKPLDDEMSVWPADEADRWVCICSSSSSWELSDAVRERP